MDWRAQQITKAIKRYDRELYAEKGVEDRIDIFRRTMVSVPYDFGDFRIVAFKEEPYRVFCLTDNWRPWGKPVEWGIEPILAKIKASDLWQRDIVKDVNKSNEKIDASEDRSKKNEIEAFVKDFRPQFARAFDDVNTANLSKRNDRRFKDDRKIKSKG